MAFCRATSVMRSGRSVGRHRQAVTAASLVPGGGPPQDLQQPVGTTGPALAALRQHRRDERGARYAAIRRLHQDGVPPRHIAPTVLGMSQRAVERWLAAGGAPEHRRPAMASMLGPVPGSARALLGCRLPQGNPPLARDPGGGFPGQRPDCCAVGGAAPRSSVARPSPLEARISGGSPTVTATLCAWLLGCERDKVSASQRDVVDRITAAVPALGVAADRRGGSPPMSGDPRRQQTSTPGSPPPARANWQASLRASPVISMPFAEP